MTQWNHHATANKKKSLMVVQIVMLYGCANMGDTSKKQRIFHVLIVYFVENHDMPKTSLDDQDF